MPAVQRYLAMMDTAGLKISARDVFSDPGKLRTFSSGCNFEWMDGKIDEDLEKCGIIDDESVKMRDRVGVFSWYRKNRRSGTETEKDLNFAKQEGELLGIFFHGGVSIILWTISLPLCRADSHMPCSHRLSLTTQLIQSLKAQVRSLALYPYRSNTEVELASQ